MWALAWLLFYLLSLAHWLTVTSLLSLGGKFGHACTFVREAVCPSLLMIDQSGMQSQGHLAQDLDSPPLWAGPPHKTSGVSVSLSVKWVWEDNTSSTYLLQGLFYVKVSKPSSPLKWCVFSPLLILFYNRGK